MKLLVGDWVYIKTSFSFYRVQIDRVTDTRAFGEKHCFVRDVAEDGTVFPYPAVQYDGTERNIATEQLKQAWYMYNALQRIKRMDWDTIPADVIWQIYSLIKPYQTKGR